MRLRRKICITMIVTLSSVILMSCTQREAVEEIFDEPKEIVIWYWGPELEVYADWYMQEINPNVTFDIVSVQSNEYYQKWIQTYLSGGKLPDIAILEKSYRQNLINITDAWEDLESQEYNVIREDLFDYTIAQITNENDQLVSIEMGLTPVCLGYKVDIAEKYLGVTEPEDMEAMFSTWEDLLEIGETLNNETGGEVFLFSNTEDLIAIIKAHESEEIVDSEGTINRDALSSVVSALKEVYDKKLINPRLYNDSDGIGATIAGDEVLFCVSPIWGPEYIIQMYDPDSEGRWRLMEMPGGNISMGGSSLAISTSSEVKLEAFDFIKNVFLTEEGAEMMVTEVGALSTYQGAYDSESSIVFGESDVYFGGQDIISKFIQVAEELPEQVVAKYSSAEDIAINQALEAMIASDVTLEVMVDIAWEQLTIEIEMLGQEEQQ